MAQERISLRLTVVDACDGHRVEDVLIDALPGSTAEDLGEALRRKLGIASTGENPASDLTVDGAPLARDQMIGSPPLLDGAVILMGPGQPSHEPHLVGMELHVVSGPDAGQILHLSPGEHLLGRCVDAHLRLEDEDVSRAHALVVVHPTQVTVTDLDSTNGVLLDGRPLDRTTILTTSSVLQLGQSSLRLRLPTDSLASVRPDGSGHLLVNRRPRVVGPDRAVVVRFPHDCPPVTRSRLNAAAVLVPLLLSGMLAAVLRSPTMLLFGLMSPVLLVTTWATERRGAGSRRRAAQAEHRDALAFSKAQLRDALHAERKDLERRHPDPALVLCVANGPQHRLWERRTDDPDALVLRLGTGSLPSATRVVGETAPDASSLEDVPVTVALRDVGVLGVAGPRAQSIAIARSALGQLVTWHSPLDLQVALLVDDPIHSSDWTWASLLPHLRGESPGRQWVGVLDAPEATDSIAAVVAAVARVVADRAAARDRGGPAAQGPDLVVVLDGAERLRGIRGLSGILERGPAVGVHAIAVETSRERLPVETGCVVDATRPGGVTLHVREHESDQRIVPDAPQARWAVRLGRALAPLRDATPGSVGDDLPDSVNLLDLLGQPGLQGETVAAGWRVQPRSTVVPLGMGPVGPILLDLQRDGPHALVSGTTGSGKSELLQSMIASLSLANRPDEMTFVLIDYKGGSAFRQCARLPHTLGVVTDLDAHLTARALSSLGAELRRRERLLAEAGAVSLTDYQANSNGPTIARLILVVDEFRLLVEELPEFVQALVRIAAIGRSLGVHLILATQRPGGVVSADMRANVGLRISLRVQDRLDSLDVVEAPDAAAIPERTPGRAFVRSASTPLTQFQTARVSGTERQRARVAVALRPLAALSQAPIFDDPPGPDAVEHAPDLDRIIAATGDAVALLGVPPVPAPWLAPLPDVVHFDSLDPPGPPAPGRPKIPLGLRDDPEHQRQGCQVWDLHHDGHLGITGGPRTGRTTALRTVAGALASFLGPDEMHVFVFHTGGLSALSQLPHTAAVAGRDDLEHAVDVIRVLTELVRVRRSRAARGDADVTEPPEQAHGDSHASLPWLVLLIDEWESFIEGLMAVEHGRPVQDLMALMRDGASSGVRAAATGERALVAGQFCGLFSTRLALKFSDPLHLALAGVPTKAVPAHQPPGRVINLADHRETQLAILGEDASAAAQAAALARLGRIAAARRVHADPASLPAPVKPLPRVVSLEDLKPVRLGPGRVAIGVRAGDLTPVGFDLADGRRRFLIVGPAESGRTTALVTAAQSISVSNHPTAFVGGTGPVTLELPPLVFRIGPDDDEELVSLRRRHPDLAVLVDDLDRVVGARIEPVLREITRLVDQDEGLVVAATCPAAVSGFQPGLPTDLHRAQRGLWLCPSPNDGDVLGIRATRDTERIPGRGILVADGHQERIQVARCP